MRDKAIEKIKKDSGCSAVRLAHLLWEQGVVGSNPATPTKEKGFDNQWFDAVFKAFFIIKIFILLIKKKGIFAHQWTQKLIQNLSFNFNQYGNSQTNNFQSKSFKRWQT